MSCDCHVMQVEAEKYALGVRWLKEVLYGVQFTKERLLVVANKMINDVSRFKRKGSHVAKTLIWHQLYLGHASHNTSSMLTQLSFLTSLVNRLGHAPQDVVATMGVVRERLTATGNLRVFMATNVIRATPPGAVEVLPSYQVCSNKNDIKVCIK